MKRLSASLVSGEQIAGWLSSGAAVILPTETVYGLAVKPGAEGIERVLELKGRPRHLNLPVIIGEQRQLAELGVDFDRAARLLANELWPGPLTLVMGFSAEEARPAWLAGREEVAIRLPGHQLLREVATAAGPILVTSANGHGEGAKSVAAEAADSLHGPVDVIVDGGTLTGVPSTIVNTRLSPPRIEREGAIAAERIAALLGLNALTTR